MNANAVPLLQVFEKKLVLEVPIFQRQYVWSEERQFAPLWEDLRLKYEDLASNRDNIPGHFLGAIVLDQKQTPTTFVERRQVIDGQQRLSTTLILLAALRDVSHAFDCRDMATECDTFIFNTGKMSDPEREQLKLLPTESDRDVFASILTARSLEDVDRRFPSQKRRYQRKHDPPPAMVACYRYFYSCFRTLLEPSSADPASSDDQVSRPQQKVEMVFRALKDYFHVVVIDLGNEDDAQVIFETLNGRGEPLLPSDLLRNYIFLRAGRRNEHQQGLYNRYWRHFEEDDWKAKLSQGRVSHQAIDLFLLHFLEGRTGRDVSARHLFAEYKHWIERKAPYNSVEDELRALDRSGRSYLRLLAPKAEDVVHPISSALVAFDMKVVFPLLLNLLDRDLSSGDWVRVSMAVESYIVRRAVCGYTLQNYNRVFLAIARDVAEEGDPAAFIDRALRGLSGPSTAWPSDDEFREGWMHKDFLGRLTSKKAQFLFLRLNEHMTRERSDASVSIPNPSIEHVMPKKWHDAWLLPSGARGTEGDGAECLADRRVIEESRKRDGHLNMVGNLALVSREFNSELSNSSWNAKRQVFREGSILPINRSIADSPEWSEKEILQRSESLWHHAISLWKK